MVWLAGGAGGADGVGGVPEPRLVFHNKRHAEQ